MRRGLKARQQNRQAVKAGGPRHFQQYRRAGRLDIVGDQQNVGRAVFDPRQSLVGRFGLQGGDRGHAGELLPERQSQIRVADDQQPNRHGRRHRRAGTFAQRNFMSLDPTGPLPAKWRKTGALQRTI